VVAAINGDYFGRNHGPEGLTVKNGRRLDHDRGRRQNTNALWRSSLAISRLNRASLGRKSVEELNKPGAYQELFFNAVGGGPMILNFGVVIPNVVACLLEQFPVGACRRTIQTAVGLSKDGHQLFWAVGKGRDIQGFARLLRDYGAYTAIKLDGGGSSQLWYDGEMRHDTERPVGNALLVLYSPVPRHDARFRERANVFVVEPNDRFAIALEIQNTGFLDWQPELGYRFKNVKGWPVIGPGYRRLPSPVSANGSLHMSWSFDAPHYPGVYRVEWQLMHRAEPIGTRLSLDIVVVPPDSTETGFKAAVQGRLAEQLSRPGFEQEWPSLRRELEQEIWRQVESDLRAALTDGDGRLNMYLEATIREQWMPPLRPLSW
jgi:uncharacterized protein YigE (DUF2233 family)